MSEVVYVLVVWFCVVSSLGGIENDGSVNQKYITWSGCCSVASSLTVTVTNRCYMVALGANSRYD